MLTKQSGVKEGGTAVASRLPINFGFVPAVWMHQENTSVFVTGHMQTRFHRLANSWELSAHRQLLGKSWPRCTRRKHPQTGQSKTLLGLELGKAMAEAGSAPGMDLVFICDI